MSALMTAAFQVSLWVAVVGIGWTLLDRTTLRAWWRSVRRTRGGGR